jgi:hypothetical protein
MINKQANAPYSPPYKITEDSGAEKYNDLFQQLFKDKANLGLKEFENLSKDGIAPDMQNGIKQNLPTAEKELFFNKTASGYDLCVRIGADVYKVVLTKM